MSTAELKNQIIERLKNINDDNLLIDIYKLVQMESELETIYQLSETEKEGIELALNDIDEGKTYSSSKANDLLREWIKK